MRAFLLGMYEFQRDFTTHFDEPEINQYDLGREWAHRLTFRVFESDPAMYRMPISRKLLLRGPEK